MIVFFFVFLTSCFAQYDPQRVGKGRIAPQGVGAGLHFGNAVDHGPNGAQRPFVYNHVAKTGGSFVKNVLIGLFGQGNINILEEWHGLKALELPAEGPRRPFVMGAIRAPCDYYLSLWSFTSGGTIDRVVGTVKEIRQFEGKDAGFSSPADIQRFRKWVRGLSSKNLNLLTARFWFSYFKAGNPCKPREGHVCAGKQSAFESMRTEIEQDLAGADMADIADCWLRTEYLEADLRSCLKKYEQEAGVTIDWVLFEELLRKKEKNKSERTATCEEFYDDATKDLVLTKDSHVVRLFGYDKCCASKKPRDEDGTSSGRSAGGTSEL